MSNLSVSRRTFLVLLIVSTFILADLSLVNVISNEEQTLSDEPIVKFATSVDYPSKDTMINSSSPNSNYGLDTDSPLGQSLTGESRLLFTFPMNLSGSSSINSATLSLTCSTTVLGSQDATIYFAELSRNFDEVNATWMLPNTAQSWNLMGADGSSDRGDFEPPISITMNTTFSLNVTKIAQDSARSNQSTMSVIVASLGAEYNCAMSENTNSQSRPSLTLDYSSSPMGNGGSFDVLTPLL